MNQFRLPYHLIVYMHQFKLPYHLRVDDGIFGRIPEVMEDVIPGLLRRKQL